MFNLINDIAYLAIPLVLLALIIAFIYSFWKKNRLESLDLRVLLVRIQKQNEKDPKDFLKDINVSEQLINSLSSLGRPFVFEIAVHNTAQHINFYVAVPRRQLDFAKQQIQGLFLAAQVEEAPEYTIFSSGGESVGGYLSLAESSLIPLRTYREAEVDTFAPILSTLSKLKEVGEGAAIQLIVKPASEGHKKVILKSLGELKKGKKLTDILNASFFKAEDFAQAVFGRPKDDSSRPPMVDEEAVKAFQLKMSKPLYEVNVRIVTAAATKDRAEEIFLSVTGAFSQFTAALRNSFIIIKPRNLKKFIFNYAFREYDLSQIILLNSEELGSIFHVPTYSSEVPRVEWLKTKEVPPPANLPSQGIMIGESIFRGDRKPVYLTDADRLRHLYLVGQTGVGKSYGMILPMVVSDIERGAGVCVIDPHGDLIDDILDRIPAERVDDVIVFDPGNLARPIGINMLEYNLAKPEERSFIVNEMINIFDRLYDLKVTGGPMFEYYLRNALLLLMEDAGNDPTTLLDVPRVFSDSNYRNAKLARVKNPLVIDFWTKEAAKATGEQGLQNMTVYIASKFASFISNDYLRPIIGQTKSAFNFRAVMDNKKILLVKLAKGRIGDLNANLLGMIFTGRMLMAALSRGDLAKEARQNFYFYIDEFQNFTTDSISIILSEARKYGLGLTIAHQFIAQLEDKIRDSVFGNVGSMIAFRVGMPDTEVLVKQFGPEFDAQDLISTENQHALAKLLINGEPSRPFNLECQYVSPAPHPELRAKLEELSRLTYGRDLAEVEQDIVKRLRGV